MATDPDYDQTFPSTTFEWRRVKVNRRPQGTSTARRSRSGWRHLVCWPRSEKVTLSVSWKSGAESWWLVQARGSQQVLPGWMCLEDVMALVCNEQCGGPRQGWK